MSEAASASPFTSPFSSPPTSPPSSPPTSPSSSPPTSPPTQHASSALLASLAPLLHEWLPRQRWFAGKGRPVAGFSLVSATELLPLTGSPGLLHLLVRVQQPATSPPPPGPPPPADCYQLFLGVRRSLPPTLSSALVGRVPEGPLAGRTVYEGLADPRLAGLLLERLRVPGALGTLRFDRDPERDVPAGLAPRALGAEQSNSSLVYGNAYILKVFRRVQAGANPDLELPLALAREGCARVPAPVAWFQGANPDDASEPFTLGLLQPFLHDAEDGWQLALKAIAAGSDFTAEAHALGRATAEVHTTLAATLPTRTLGRPQADVLAGQMTERLEAAVQAVPALLPYAPGLREAFEAVRKLGAAGPLVTTQRVHGDLHLGQTLRGPDGEWAVIDFEGEPAKPLTERRHPQPVVRDIAGMLRSFDYAARMLPDAVEAGRPGETVDPELTGETVDPETPGETVDPETPGETVDPETPGETVDPETPGETPPPWNPDWAGRCRAAFCEGYAAASGTDPRHQPELLRAYETDKAVYEVLYEARHRPDWLPVPMAAVRRLATPMNPHTG